MFGLGFSIIGILSFSYVYICEMLSPDQMFTFNLVWPMMDGVANSVAVICYMYVANNYFYITAVQFSLAIISLILVI
jgi:hypothetical protein